MVFCYGFCDAAVARREYMRRYPNRRVPNERVFSGTWLYHRRRRNGGRSTRFVPVKEEEILEAFRRDPITSTRIVARLLGTTQWKVWFTVNTAGLYPYHYTPVQRLEKGDPVRKLDYCRFMINADLEHYYGQTNPSLIAT